MSDNAADQTDTGDREAPFEIDADELRDDIIADPKAFYCSPRTAEQSDTVARSLARAINAPLLKFNVTDEDGRTLVVDFAVEPDGDFESALCFADYTNHDPLAPVKSRVMSMASFRLDIPAPETFDPSAGRWCGITRADAASTADYLVYFLDGMWAFLRSNPLDSEES